MAWVSSKMTVRFYSPIQIKKSVFVFLRSVILIEFFFAFLPLIATLIINLSSEYERIPLSKTISYDVLAITIFASLQILTIAIAFAFWYFPSYEISQDAILLLRSNLVEDRKLADLEQLKSIHLKQGWLGKRTNYGTLVCELSAPPPAYVRDIPNPVQARDIILELSSQIKMARLLEPRSITEYLTDGEGQFVEYKSSLMWDYRQQQVNKDLYEPVMKTLAAFMNSQGGTLLIGINDEGEILGLEPDFLGLKKRNVDGFENTFNMAFNKMLGVQYRQHVEVTFPVHEDKIICLVRVRPSSIPVYMQHQGQESFYVRAGNGTQALTVSQAAQYIQDRFDG